MATIGDLLNQAVHYHQGGDLVRAEWFYRQILESDPDNTLVHTNLGLALAAQGKFAEAAACFRQTTRINPNDAGAFTNLGNALKYQGKPAEAAEPYRQALRLQPQDAGGHFNLGNVLKDQAKPGEAAACFRQALRLDPNHADARNNLGIILFEQRQLAEASQCFQETLRLNPNHPDAWTNLGTVLFEQGQLPEAGECFRQSLRFNPNDTVTHHNLGNLLRTQGLLDEAIASFQLALRLNPNNAETYNSLGNAFKDQGCLDDAIGCFQNACKLYPQNPAWPSNYLLTLNYHPGYDSRAILEEHRRWEKSLQPLPNPGRTFANKRSPERRLRIGYVSSDFRDHVVGRNVWPLLRCHDHHNFEITLYSCSAKCDAMTERFRKCADHWCPIFGWSDGQIADRIRHDKIDILVDLALHTSGNRLPVFAGKPAPVQVTFAGYPGTTGLSAIDYRLTDYYLDPPGLLDSCYAEASYRLPHSFWCYDPSSDQPPVTPLPTLEKGFITFGCLNNFCKVNNGVLEIWARVLIAVPGSRLLLLAKQGSHRQRTLAFLGRHGVDSRRVEFQGEKPRHDYLALYHQLDIGLDTFPYNGHTTSLDSLWMGVPVITLVGNTVVSRAGLSQLTNLGLEKYAASTPDRYVQLATKLAYDLPILKGLRAGLRDRMQQSPLMDAPGFARGIEDAYRDMWRRWCEGHLPPGSAKRA